MRTITEITALAERIAVRPGSHTEAECDLAAAVLALDKVATAAKEFQPLGQLAMLWPGRKASEDEVQRYADRFWAVVNAVRDLMLVGR